MMRNALWSAAHKQSTAAPNIAADNAANGNATNGNADAGNTSGVTARRPGRPTAGRFDPLHNSTSTPRHSTSGAIKMLHQ